MRFPRRRDNRFAALRGSRRGLAARHLVLLGGLLLLSALPPDSPAGVRGAFTELATFRGTGLVLNKVVGPGSTPGSEWLYLSYQYNGNTAEVVAVDPATGEYHVFPSPDKAGKAAWALVVGPDSKIYVGTVGVGKILRIDPRAATIVDLGRASPTETYIWQLVVGADNNLYGCTYPNAKLVRYDLKTGAMADLGRMDPKQKYARTLAASKDGFVYSGVGFSENHLVAYEIRTGQHRDLLPAEYRDHGVAAVKGDDGQVYGQVSPGGFGSAGVLRTFRLEGWNAIPIPYQIRPASYERLKDGRFASVSDAVVTSRDPATNRVTTHPYLYRGKEMSVVRVALGPDGMLYGSTGAPLHLFRLDPATGQLTQLGDLGSGRVHSFLSHAGSLLMGSYGGLSPLMDYQPKRSAVPGAAVSAKPSLIRYPGADNFWRPLAMIAGPGGDVYIGSMPGYGALGGSLTVFDPATDQVRRSYQVIQDQSIVSLTTWKGWIVGGTSIHGGGGSFPTATSARIFMWDPAKQQKIADVVPVAGADEITDLVTAPNGRVFGIAKGNQLFVFDPETRTIVHRSSLPFTVNDVVLYNSIGTGPDGRLYGLFAGGVFSIDPQTYRAQVEATYPVTAGFALSGRQLYFTSGSHLVRYTIAQEPLGGPGSR